MSKHTELPWRVADDEISELYIPYRTICSFENAETNDDATAANRAFIVHACNCHYQLVAALKRTAAVCAGDSTTKGELIKALESARDALAQAERPTP